MRRQGATSDLAGPIIRVWQRCTEFWPRPTNRGAERPSCRLGGRWVRGADNSDMAKMHGVLAQLNKSGGGMPKLPIGEAMVTVDGVSGDWQKNRKVHGGPNRAICVYSEELYEGLREDGVKVKSGDIG